MIFPVSPSILHCCFFQTKKSSWQFSPAQFKNMLLKIGNHFPHNIFETKLVPYRFFLTKLWARKKNLTFHYTGCLMRILIVVYETIPTWPGGMLSPKIPRNNQGPFFHCSYTSWWFQPLLKNMCNNGNPPAMRVKIFKKMKPPASIGLWSTPCLLCLPCPTSPEVAIVFGAEVPAATKALASLLGNQAKIKSWRWTLDWNLIKKRCYIIVRNYISWQDVDQDIWDL